MTEEEKKQRIAELRAELKELEATPRSDWHAGFEAALRIETHKYGNLVHIRTEEAGDEVTLSIFRAVKNPELFSELERNGNLHKSAPGIYHVKGITDLPFQIIITDELDREEYTAYRALTDKAEKADIDAARKRQRDSF